MRRPPPTTNADDLTVLARAAASGDDVAAERFVAATVLDVWRLCAGLVDRQAADDLTQLTYERALPALHRFRGEASPRTWLLTIARRVCADEIRGRARRRRLEENLADFSGTGINNGDFTDRTALHDLVECLAPERREAFVLTQIVGLRYEEAAEVLGCAVGTIRSRVARARAELQAALGEAEQPPATTPSPGFDDAPLEGRSV